MGKDCKMGQELREKEGRWARGGDRGGEGGRKEGGG